MLTLIKRAFKTAALTACMLGAAASVAQVPESSLLNPNASETMSAKLCSNATDVMANPLNYICVDSMFPIRIASVDAGEATDKIGSPWNAHKNPMCQCGMFPSYPIGMWVPDRMIEAVEQPGCSPLTGLNLANALTVALSKTLPKGRESTTADAGGGSEAGFRHVNTWQSMLPQILGLPVAKCQPTMPFETTLISPMWNANDPVTPNLLFPEWNLIYTQVIGFVKSTLSCVNATLNTKAQQPIEDAMYWQLGCWGKSLPANGRYADNDPVRGSSLVAARSLFHSARTGGNGLFLTVGDAAVCGPVPAPFPQKSGFKHSMMFPFTEKGPLDTSGRAQFDIKSPLSQIQELNPLAAVFSSCAHSIGSSHWRWGMGKHKAVTPRDYVYMQWRWIDCCQ